jgi:hypothetical protein
MDDRVDVSDAHGVLLSERTAKSTRKRKEHKERREHKEHKELRSWI